MMNLNKWFTDSIGLVLLCILTGHIVYAQQVEVQGELIVTEMTANDSEENLVTRNTDGTLGTRSISSLPPPPRPIDTTRNLASDFELVKHLCNCPNLPPFMIKQLLDSGYTEEDLIGSGVPVQDVLDAERGGLLLDSRDNQTYKTVTIGTQTWMAENLNYGQRITHPNDQLDNAIVEKYCYSNDDSNCDTYGGIYQWDEMMQYVTTEGVQGVCPTGWHLPTDDEWKTLEMELGMTQAQADITGDRGTDQGSRLSGEETLWDTGGLVENSVFGSSGFNLLPGGLVAGLFFDLSYGTELWSSTEVTTSTTFSRWIRNYDAIVNRWASSKTNGRSV